ncbi:MAG: thiamine phosphate synthase [Pyrinomonadaceae bacterium]|nr:thiamine phosphate synthase [Pyrinomonadaceae bacterium]
MQISTKSSDNSKTANNHKSSAFHNKSIIKDFLNVSAPIVYVITNGEMTDANFSTDSQKILEIVRAAVKSKVSLIQIREKKLSARNVFEITKRAAEIAKNSNGKSTKILVNDRADIALAANADGVHLTSKSLSAKIIRQNFPQNFVIGTSCHSVEDVEKSEIEGADFATFSPIFETPSKMKYGKPQGLEKLREVCETVKNFPVIALGGIDILNFSECLNVGAKGIAAIKLFDDSENLREIVKKIYAK